MAEKITIAELDIDSKALATKNASLLKQISILKKQQAELRKSTTNLTGATDKQLKSYVNTDTELKKLNTSYAQNKTVLAEVTTGVKTLSQALNKEVKSVKDAQKNNSKLIKLRNQVNIKTKEGQKAITQINKKLDQNNKLIKQNSSAIEKQRLNIGNYASALDRVVPGLSRFIGGLQGTGTALKASTSSLKAFRIALIATGIGAIVIALVALVGAFASTQSGMDLVTKATDAMGAVLDVVIRRLVEFGGGLIKFFSGDFAEGIEEMGNAFKGAGAEIVQMVKSSNALSDATVKLEEAQNKFIVTNARLRTEMKEFNKIAEDTNKTLDERIEASKKAEEVDRRRTSIALSLAAEELRIAKARDAQGDSTREELAATFNLEAELFRIREENEERLTTQVNKTNILITQRTNLLKKATDDAIKELERVLQAIEKSEAKREKIAEDTDKRINEKIERGRDLLFREALNQTEEEGSSKLAIRLLTIGEEERLAKKQADDTIKDKILLERELKLIEDDFRRQREEAIALSDQEIFEARLDKIQERATEIGAILNGFAQNILIKSKQNADAEIRDINKVFEARFEAAGEDQGRVIRLEKEKEKEIRKVQDRQRATAKKIAIFEKTLAISQSIINTALAVTKTLTALPFPFSLPAALSVGLFGLAKTAVIASRPIPKFAKGTKRILGDGSETSDSVPALLSKNERVVDAKNNRKIGFDLSNDQLATAAQMYRSFRLNGGGGMGGQGIIDAIDKNTKVLRGKGTPHTSVHVSDGHRVINKLKYLT